MYLLHKHDMPSTPPQLPSSDPANPATCFPTPLVDINHISNPASRSPNDPTPARLPPIPRPPNRQITTRLAPNLPAAESAWFASGAAFPAPVTWHFLSRLSYILGRAEVTVGPELCFRSRGRKGMAVRFVLGPCDNYLTVSLAL